MSRTTTTFSIILTLAWLMTPRATLSQIPDHVDQEHNHVGEVVSCTTLASPPWTGLSSADQEQFAALQESVSGLKTPEAARAAGFNPTLGDIPGMGVHYVNTARSRDGVQRNAPDHLLFIEIDGRERLVGAAYAFIDVPETEMPIPFESDLATWHDHPQFADDGRTLHMLHTWFIPSSNGPFAGLNFWLPYLTTGVALPSSCWMADEADAERIRNVSFALVGPRAWGATSWPGRPSRAVPEPSAERVNLLVALDFAARALDHDGWVEAADNFLADLSESERMRVAIMLRTLTQAQMSSAQRGGDGN